MILFITSMKPQKEKYLVSKEKIHICCMKRVFDEKETKAFSVN